MHPDYYFSMKQFSQSIDHKLLEDLSDSEVQTKTTKFENDQEQTKKTIRSLTYLIVSNSTHSDPLVETN